MKILWEGKNWSGSSIEPTITCLAWMKSPTKEAKGLLAVGSESGVVGVTYTDLYPDETCNKRYNFNLRGHHSAIAHVSWNKPQSKLVSCDISGFIYVWVPNDERWSVELVNDRGVKVKDFCWSPNGTATLICYEDNFVLIGTASGQRVWSNNYDITVNCGAWSPNSEEVVMGFSTGSLQVLNEHGNVIHERENIFGSEIPVTKVAFSSIREDDKKFTLAICSAEDEIVFANTYYVLESYSYQSFDKILKIEWSSDGTMLAIVCPCNRITILGFNGEILHNFIAPLSKELTGFTWAHDDTSVIVAAGGHLAVGRVVPGIPRLSTLVSYKLWQSIGRNVEKIDSLTLPPREKIALKVFDHHIIRCRVPRPSHITKAITIPTDWRWYCTIVPVPKKSYHYMLCMEHMGGLVPILLGRQINRIIPQFLISLPSHLHNRENVDKHGSSAQVEDLATFRHESNQRTSLWRQSKRQFRKFMNKRVAPRTTKVPPTLVQVSSNVWCTKFKITSPGMKDLPQFLANVVYKTSVLHLQPRQMTIHLTDLREQELNVSELSKSIGNTPLRTPEKKSNMKRIISEDVTTVNSINTPLNGQSTPLFGMNNVDVDELQRLLDNDILNDNFNGQQMEFDDDHETELLAEEKQFYTTVLTEFDGLKQAVNNHIENMKKLAMDLEQLSNKKPPTATNNPNLSVMEILKRRRSLQNTRNLLNDNGDGRNINENVNNNVVTARPSTSSGIPQDDNWNERIENIEYIDTDDNVIDNNDGTVLIQERIRKNVKNSEYSSKKKQKQQLNDIRAVVEKLSTLANDLSMKSPNLNTRNPSVNLRVGNNAVGSKLPKTTINGIISTSDLTVGQLRAEIRTIAQQVSQIEEKITIDMLNDIRGDLQQRVEHIKAVLGEPLMTESTTKFEKKPRTLTMTNKTPFWNEQTQVYQLDFGGRVTQESAKNFQIEYNSEQVMQFGRIENGAYTLDFRQPFSAIQAFAIALASITQRLK